ncbi:unnamed protein product, partial [Amoebophrya sp. A25]|eukprot:GSA25T00000117001.1
MEKHERRNSIALIDMADQHQRGKFNTGGTAEVPATKPTPTNVFSSCKLAGEQGHEIQQNGDVARGSDSQQIKTFIETAGPRITSLASPGEQVEDRRSRVLRFVQSAKEELWYDEVFSIQSN